MTQEDNKLVAERRRKLADLRAAGFTFPNGFRRSALAGQLHSVYEGYSNESLEADPVDMRGPHVRVPAQPDFVESQIVDQDHDQVRLPRLGHLSSIQSSRR